MPAIYRNGTRYGNAPTSYPAENVAYDPTTSNLPATNAQNAIDELADATPRIASAGPAAEVIFNTDTVAPFKEIKCSVNAIQEGTPWIYSNIVNKEPYLFRKIAGTASRIGNSEFTTLIGGTCGVNQLVQNANKSYDNTITESNPSHLFTDIAYPIIENHVYLLHVTDLTNIPTIEPFMQTGWWHKPVVDGYCMLKADTHYGDYGWLGYRSIDQTTPLGTVNIKFDNYFVIDLTAMFGTTIADYVYNLENG